ncbi:MAG TPA: MATE family efflux transporter [Polyangiaceae bacterium]|nr:MATE family efflux transporter [Polyangiaceae bacterium]
MNLPWQERPLRELIRLAWPIALSMVSYSVMTVVDTLLIGHVGRAELAGVGLGGISAFVLLCFSFGLLQGAKVLVSQAIGANRSDRASAYLGAAIGTALVVGFITVLIGQGVALLIGHLASTEAAGQAAGTYLRIRILGAPLALLYVALREVRYAEGDPRSPMRATVAAQATNILLAVTFIFVLHWGVAGAAFATVLAHAVEAGTLYWAQRSRGFGLRAVRRQHVVELFRMGLPTGLQFALEVGAFATLSLMISLFSEVEMAAHHIAIQVIHLSFLPAMAVAEAASVLTGQAVGAGSFGFVKRVAHLAMGITAAYALAWSLLLAFGAPLIVSGFTIDPAVVSVATRLLYVAAVFQIFDASNIVARCSLRGAGDVRYAAVVGVLTSWLCTPTLAWVLGAHYKLGAFGGWLGLCLEIIVSSAILWWRLERRGWLSAATLSRARLTADQHLEPRAKERLAATVMTSTSA